MSAVRNVFQGAKLAREGHLQPSYWSGHKQDALCAGLALPSCSLPMSTLKTLAANWISVASAALTIAGCAGPARQPELPTAHTAVVPATVAFVPATIPRLTMPPSAFRLPPSAFAPVPSASADAAVNRHRPSVEEIEAMNIGPQPSDYQQQVRAFMAPKLQDPRGARIRFEQPPKKGVRAVGDAMKVSWFVVAFLNDRSQRGGYVGEDRYYFFFEDGAIVDYRNFDADLRQLLR